MKKYGLSLMCILAFNTCFGLTIPQPKQVIVVDCGSSGTRIHLFVKNGSTVKEPYAKAKDTPGLSSFIDDGSKKNDHGVDTTEIQQHMLDLVSKWKNANKSDPIIINSNTPIYVYATAGLRLVRQDAANSDIKYAGVDLQKDLGLKGNLTTKVISGNEEALYDWLGGNFSQPAIPATTDGILDLGGASTEMAFNLSSYDGPTDLASSSQYSGLKIFNKTYEGHHYHIATQSLLGEGQNEGLASINGNFITNRAVCYPKGVWSDEALGMSENNPIVNYSFGQCQKDVKQFFINKKINESLEGIHQWLGKENKQRSVQWKAISGFYYTAQFFQANNPSEIKKNASKDDDHSWSHVQTEYRDQPPQFLQSFFFAAAYTTELLKEMLDGNDTNVNFTSGADWTNGVAYDYFFQDKK